MKTCHECLPSANAARQKCLLWKKATTVIVVGFYETALVESFSNRICRDKRAMEIQQSREQ